MTEITQARGSADTAAASGDQAVLVSLLRIGWVAAAISVALYGVVWMVG